MLAELDRLLWMMSGWKKLGLLVGLKREEARAGFYIGFGGAALLQLRPEGRQMKVSRGPPRQMQRSYLAELYMLCACELLSVR